MKVAVVQYPPAFLDLERCLELGSAHIAQAAREGASLVVFPEAWFPGYPVWTQFTRPYSDWAAAHELIALLHANAVNLAHDGLAPLHAAAREHSVVVVVGHQELESQRSMGTIYNSVAIIDADGTILNNHRKVMPTYSERMVWGYGDASTLKVVDTAVGRIGTLLCWENLMPLARYAIYAQSPDIYVAPTYDSSDGWQATMHHIARESGAWVVAGATSWQAKDLPADLPHRDLIVDDEEMWLNVGDAVVHRPGGGLVAGPMHQQHGLLVAEIDLAESGPAHTDFDVTGHYSRPDLFTLHVNTGPQERARFAPQAP